MSISSNELAQSLLDVLKAGKALRSAPSSSLEGALDNMALPTGDAKAKGPSSPISDAKIDELVGTLERAIATQQGVQSAIKSVMGILF